MYKNIVSIAITTLLGLQIFIGSESALAQVATAPEDKDKPIEIEADNALKWDRPNKIYTATGNAIAKQGKSELLADQIDAHYREGQAGTSEIWQIIATKNVKIKSDPQTAYGEHAIYDVEKGTTTLTGGDLKIVTPTETIKADNKIIYLQNEQKLVAYGGATASRDNEKLEADKLTAVFKPTAAGKTELDHIKAEGHVTITTPTETVYGDHGIYNPKTERATLHGNVFIQRGKDWLNGRKIEVDLAKGTSELFAAPDSDGEKGRVRGVFHPKK